MFVPIRAFGGALLFLLTSDRNCRYYHCRQGDRTINRRKEARIYDRKSRIGSCNFAPAEAPLIANID